MGEAAGFEVGFLSHAGDGNIHPEIFCDLREPGTAERVDALHDRIVRYVIELGGSFTGEHGVGLEKRRHMPQMYGPDELQAMRDVKAAFDPQDQMNPGKIFPEVAPAQPAPPWRGGRDFHAAPHPTSTPELQEIMAGLQVEGRQAWLGGSGTKCAPPVDVVDGAAAVSTTGLGGLLRRAYEDLYVTVGAGAKVAEVAAELQADGFVFPLAAPWPEATVGGTIAACFNAPWRGIYGGIREVFLCADVVLPGGRLLRLGRPLVKDVAGYSLHKLFIGSWGTLGALAAVSLRVSPQPQTCHTWRVACPDLPAALGAAHVLGEEAELVCALLLDGRQQASAPLTVVCTYAGPAEDVAVAARRSRGNLAQAKLPEPEPAEESGVDLWKQALNPGHDARQVIVRAGVPLSAMPALLAAGGAAPPGGWLADLANGLAYFISPDAAGECRPWESAARRVGREKGGYALALGRSLYPPRGLQIGPENLRLWGELKRRWDPAGILNAGVFSRFEEEM